MSALKKPKKISENENTSTRTALAEPGDSMIEDLLNESKKLDPALVVIQGDQLGQVFHLKKEGTTTLGRHPDCDIIVKQRAVSSIHAEFRITDTSEVTLNDLGSTNGTILNNNKIDRPVILRGGDLIKIGTQVLKYFDKKADTKLLEKLGHQSKTDSLTGVWNKGHLMQALNSGFDIARRGYPLSVILFDIDHFKKINDSYGHLAGDYVLKELCKMLKETVLRTEDVFGRFGGEEFMLILPDSPLKVGLSIAERLRQGIEKHPFIHESRPIKVTSSFGVEEWNEKHKLPEDILEACDKALYKAKSEGRNCVCTLALT
ncbi:MAG: GGDEF domain-containing protein [Bdellovibrionota bacterium]